MTPAEDAELNRYFATIGYFPLLFVIPLIFRPDSNFAQFHAKQGLVFTILAFFILIIIQLPIVGSWLIYPLGLILLILMTNGMANGMAGRKERLPVIGRVAKSLF